MTREFFEKNARTIHEKLTGMGATFKFTIYNPEQVFLKSGYRVIDTIPIVEKAVRLSMPRMPEIVWKVLRRMLPQGYSIFVFRT